MKTKSKQRLKSAVSILLMLAVVITGAFAYFTATDSKKNVFTIGNVNILLHEDDWTENEDGDSNHIDGDNINVLPGDKINKAPYIENVGDNNAIVYMTIGIPTFQKDNSRPDPYAIAFDNTNIPVNAYAVQEMYGNLTDVNEIWVAYCQNEAADMFGTAVTDEAALLNRIELFNLPADLGSGWTQLGEVFKSEDGFNYYTFAYNSVIEPTAKTSEVIEWVQLNPVLTQNADVLFAPDEAVVDYYTKTDIGESAAAEIYGEPADEFNYAGGIELDYVPEDGDLYFVSNANTSLTFNSDSSQWEVESTVENPVDEDLIPDIILNKTTAIIIDPQADPDPNHTSPQDGDVWEDGDYIYKYNYYYNGSDYWYSGAHRGQNGWGVAVKDKTKISYIPMRNEIWGKPVNNADSTFFACRKLTATPVLSVNLTSMSSTFSECSALIDVSTIPDGVIDMHATFSGCTKLTKAPILPDSVDTMTNTFERCTRLTEVPMLPQNVIYMNNAFYACKALTKAPDLPDSAQYITGIFQSCPSLTEAPKIPEHVVNMVSAFDGCTSLTTAPIIPNEVSLLRYAFRGCTSLTGDVYIPDSVTSMDNIFSNTVESITMYYNEGNTIAENVIVPDNVTKVCIDA